MRLNKKIDCYRNLPRYESEYLSRVYIIGALMILMVSLSLMMFSVLRQTIITPSIAFVVLDIFLLFLMFGLVMAAKIYLSSAFHVFINGQVIIGLNMFGAEKKFDLAELREVVVSKMSRFQIILKYGRRGEMQINANIDRCGELMEYMLSEAMNIEKVEIDALPTLESNFGLMSKKKPDWTIINTAKRRAEENRKKLQDAKTVKPSINKSP